LIGGAALALCCSAQAAGLCSTGAASGGIGVSDVVFVDATGRTVFASDCYGVVDGVATASTLGDYQGGPFSAVIASGAPGETTAGRFGDISFTLTASGLGTEFGTWTLGWAGALPSTLDIVAVIQSTFVSGPSSFASYLFDALPAAGGLAGRWAINFGSSEDLGMLSQFAIYARDTAPTPPPPTPTPVDEPPLAALVALAGLALAITRRRPKAARV
jgi:hypothetical protein